MTVLPQPKAPGMAVVPPWTQLEETDVSETISSRLCGWNGWMAVVVREEGVEYSLSSKQRMVGTEFVSNRSHLSHRPDLHHAVAALLTIELNLQ